jgi:phosphoglycerol transferase MdoB-like AlkP superfamily enzyme
MAMRLSLFCRLSLILFLFYMSLRGQFLFWNHNLFTDESFSDLAKAFWVGIPFDLVAMAWSLMPVLIWGWFVRGLYWIPYFLIQIPFWILSVIDIEMWKFWGRRMTFSSLEILKEGEGKTVAIAGDFFGWILVAIAIGLVFWGASIWAFKKEWKHPFKWTSKRIWAEQIIIVILLVLAARGGTRRKPITPVNADFFNKSQMNQLTLNTNFMLIKTFRKGSLTREHFFNDSNQALQLVNGGWSAHPILPQLPNDKKTNVVIIILESFSWEYTGLNSSNPHSYTPFLDSLMKKSLNFPRALASGRRSIEGIAAILSGIPALMEEPFITSEFSTNQFEGVGHVFSKAGYDTSFYHGGGNGTMHFDAFAIKAGIQNYFGSDQNPFPQDNDGVWGIYDRPYLKYFAEELSKKKEPFLSALFTLSSHQPYKIPQGEPYDKMKTPHPILNAIAYSDSALEDFFKAAEKTSWYGNTLFVLVADHTGPQVFTSFEDKISAYRIPLLFFHPHISEWPSEIDRNELAQQIDIPASLYDFVGLNEAKTVALSRSVFRPGPRTFTAFIPGTYLHTDGKTLLIEQAKTKSFVEFDSFVKVAPENPDLEKSLKAVKQVFSHGLWDNALYF